MKKGGSSAEFPDPVVEFYQQLMKKLERDLGEYEKSKPETGFKL